MRPRRRVRPSVRRRRRSAAQWPLRRRHIIFVQRRLRPPPPPPIPSPPPRRRRHPLRRTINASRPCFKCADRFSRGAPTFPRPTATSVRER